MRLLILGRTQTQLRSYIRYDTTFDELGLTVANQFQSKGDMIYLTTEAQVETMAGIYVDAVIQLPGVSAESYVKTMGLIRLQPPLTKSD